MTALPPLITTADLAARLGDPGLRLVDASWHLDGRDGECRDAQRDDRRDHARLRGGR